MAAADDGPADVPSGYVARLLRLGGPQGPLPGSEQQSKLNDSRDTGVTTRLPRR